LWLLIFHNRKSIVIDDNNLGAFEDILLKYCYLDLRMQKKIIFRNKFIHSLEYYLIENDFFNIETLILEKPMPEGDNDNLVQTHNGKNIFYTLI